MDLIIVRHGRPQRIEGADGVADPPLAPIGHEQARAVGAYLAKESIDVIVTSPMQRARQTAQPLVDLLGLEPVVIPGLVEIDQHADSYVPTEELRAEGGEAWDRVVNDPDSMHGDVDFDAFEATVIEAFEDIIATYRGKTVVAFCHALVTMAYLRHVLGYADRYAVRVDYAGLSRIQANSAGLRSVRSANETAYLGETRIVSP